jgi:threonine dehydratase
MEGFQRSGSYKPRTAFNGLLGAMQGGRLRDGIVADSSGNYAQALALAGKELGVKVTLIVPETTNPLKVAACRAYGAEVLSEGINWSNRAGAADAFAEGRDVLNLPSDSWDGIAGDGTISLEIADQVPRFDAVLVPVSTGGLIAGIAVVAKELFPDVRIIGVQPQTSGHALKSLSSGHLHRLPEPPRTIADGARTLALGERAFSVIRETVDEIVLVPDEDIIRATWLLMTRTKAVIEPTGALTFASLLGGQAEAERPVCIVSGGNADLAALCADFAELGSDPSVDAAWNRKAG